MAGNDKSISIYFIIIFPLLISLLPLKSYLDISHLLLFEPTYPCEKEIFRNRLEDNPTANDQVKFITLDRFWYIATVKEPFSLPKILRPTRELSTWLYRATLFWKTFIQRSCFVSTPTSNQKQIAAFFCSLLNGGWWWCTIMYWYFPIPEILKP